ncbi:hypothetical protein GCM10017782_22430 [Deinococcus ficus]|nr:hypothetical protein GCM10017782_22430 [Deinococcus ficus]
MAWWGGEQGPQGARAVPATGRPGPQVVQVLGQLGPEGQGEVLGRDGQVVQVTGHAGRAGVQAAQQPGEVLQGCPPVALQGAGLDPFRDQKRKRAHAGQRLARAGEQRAGKVVQHALLPQRLKQGHLGLHPPEHRLAVRAARQEFQKVPAGRAVGAVGVGRPGVQVRQPGQGQAVLAAQRVQDVGVGKAGLAAQGRVSCQDTPYRS